MDNREQICQRIQNNVCEDQAKIDCGSDTELKKRASEVAKLAEEHLKLVQDTKQAEKVRDLLQFAYIVSTVGESYLNKKKNKRKTSKMLSDFLEAAADAAAREADMRQNFADLAKKKLRALEKKYRKYSWNLNQIRERADKARSLFGEMGCWPGYLYCDPRNPCEKASRR
jgi:erythromycin esterase-like protein